MASSAIYLTIAFSVVVPSTYGFKIENTGVVRNVKFPSGSSGSAFTGATFGGQNPETFPSRPVLVYPKVAPPNALESGGLDEDLLPPFEGASPGLAESKIPSFRRSIEDVKTDPKTGYPLVAEPSWKDAGGNEKDLELPLLEGPSVVGEEQAAVDPKTGYPLVAQPGWEEAGGDGEIIELPLEDESNFGQKSEAVDPKTGYPLVAQPGWKDAGGDELILELPLEDLAVRSGSEEDGAVDPKTGYPLVAQPSWKDAGGDGDILELPLEDNVKQPDQVAVDPKTGYPLEAEPSWKHAGGDGDILQPPVEEPEEAVDPKTGYPLAAQPSWKYAGGDGEILQPPLEEGQTKPQKSNEGVDPKTGYPFVAEDRWKYAGGDETILELPLEDSVKTSPKEAVDPKTGYPLVAQPSWKDAGGNEDILSLPLEIPAGNSVTQVQGRSEVFNVAQLQKLLPPSEAKYFPLVFRYPLSTPAPIVRSVFRQAKPASSFVIQSSNQNQKRDSFSTSKQSSSIPQTNRQIESTYSYTGPENVVVTVTRFLNTNVPEKQNQQNFRGTTSNQPGRTQNLQNNKPQPVVPGVRDAFQFNRQTSNFNRSTS